MIDTCLSCGASYLGRSNQIAKMSEVTESPKVSLTLVCPRCGGRRYKLVSFEDGNDFLEEDSFCDTWFDDKLL